MPYPASPAVPVLADIAHLLESEEQLPRQLERALDLLGKVVPYDRSALLDACSSSTPRMYLNPELPAAERGLVRTEVHELMLLVSDQSMVPSGPLALPEPASGTARLAFPLIALDDVVGILMVERAGEAYQAEDLQLLAVVAAQIGAYLANVRLQSQERRTASAMKRASDLLAHIQDGFLELDASLSCMSANCAALVLFGVDQSELVGADVDTWGRLGLKSTFVEACQRALREGAPVRLRAEHDTRQDKWLDFEIYPTELGVSVFVRDVSERHAAEQFRELLLGIIGHDLRTPLSAITVSAATLLRRRTLDAPATQAVARIASSGARMTEMVTQLSDLTRIRFGHGLPIEPRATDLAQLCHEVVGEISAAHPNRKIRCDVSGDLGGRWDPARLSQVISNLVSNAVTHGDPASPVLVAVRRLDGQVSIEVHNEGRPIPGELLPVIFQPFRQVEPKGSRTGSMGLGLFIAQSIVRAHRGTIEVTSEPGAGTTFRVRLPIDVSDRVGEGDPRPGHTGFASSP